MPAASPFSLRCLLTGLGTTLALAAGLLTTAPAATAADACQTGAGVGISIEVCVPTAALTDTQAVTAKVTATVPVDYVRFSWTGGSVSDGYLLADHDGVADGAGRAQYDMRLNSWRLPAGSAEIRAQAVVIDPATSRHNVLAQASIAVSVPATTPPPAPAPFTPYLGPPQPGPRVTVAAVGDGVDGSPASEQVAGLIDSWDPDVFAYLGDVYDFGSAAEFDTWYEGNNGYGQFRSITNPTVGNHEYRLGNGAAPYFEYWGGVPHYYSYDVGGWHMVVLDSTTDYGQLTTGDPNGQLKPGSAQYEWLAADLAANAGKCTMAYLHHARYSTVANVSRDGLSQVWSLLFDRGVTAMLAGHAHTYERWTPMNRDGAAVPGGLTQIVAGTGGREIRNPKVPDPQGRVVSDHTVPGALRLDLGVSDANFAFQAADGRVLDSGTIPCRQPPDLTPPTTPGGPAISSLSPTAATISWSPSSDTAGVTGYTVRRGAVEVATVAGNVTTFRDSGLTGGRTYSWTVEALDAAGNRSARTPAATATTPFPQVSSRTLLRDLRRAAERPAGYRSVKFPRWSDADRDRCLTSSEVLLQEAVRAPAVRAGCTLTGGRWRSPYDGLFRTRPASLTVDHLVPLSEAWQSGAFRWTKTTRRQHANDLGYPSTLLAVTDKAAAAKAAREPQSWMPRKAFRCSYAAQWVAVKWRWRLAVDPAERRFLVRTLTSCGWPSVRVPGRAPIR